LIAAGKRSWLSPREDPAFPKGKGELRTFWLDVSGKKLSYEEAILASSTLPADKISFEPRKEEQNVSADQEKKIERLVNWNVEVFT
jgi:hypothetical protein